MDTCRRCKASISTCAPARCWDWSATTAPASPRSSRYLSGAIQPDAGQILVDGRAVHLRSPIDAQHAGIETVYQDLAVVPMMDIGENIFLGREPRLSGPLGLGLRFINKRRMRREAAQHLQALNIGLKSGAAAR